MSNNNSSGGMGIVGVLTIIFVVLKLTGVGAIATWSWVWVLSPLWIGFIVWLILVGIAAILYALSR